jgi:hypothetical protein
MPPSAPNKIGDAFAAVGSFRNPLNEVFPPASNFFMFGQDVQFGLRIEGNVIPAVPDESSTLVLFFIGICGVCGYSLWCRKGAAQADRLLHVSEFRNEGAFD